MTIFANTKQPRQEYIPYMKRLLLFITLCLLAAACTKTPEQKAEALIKHDLLVALAFPESYEPVETQLDSAFSPYNDPAFIDLAFDSFKTFTDLDEIIRQIKQAQAANEDYADAEIKRKALSGRLNKQIERQKEKAKKEPEFIGYIAHHRFRAQRDNGETILTGEYYLLDKDLSRLIARWNEIEYNAYDQFLQHMISSGELE